MGEDLAWTFDVGTTDRRPIVPEQYRSRVTVLAPYLGEAMGLAALMTMRPALVVEEDNPGRARRVGHWHRKVEMATSTVLVRVRTLEEIG